MFRKYWLCLILLLALPISPAAGGYLDEDPDDVFKEVYLHLLTDIPVAAARDPFIWLRLQELKRERCDQTSITELATMLEKLGYRRESASALYRFVQKCGAPTSALNRSMEIFFRLSDFSRVSEVADEYIKRAPQISHAHYMKAVGLQGMGEYEAALAKYADSIELYGRDKARISSGVFIRMAAAYAALGRFCEATAPLLTWMAYDPVTRDNSQTQKIISDYRQRGNCPVVKNQGQERIATRGHRDVVTVKVTVNGVAGNFLLDTGASYVTVKSTFAEKAKIPFKDGLEITLSTANGAAKGRLTKSDRVQLGKLEALSVPTVVQTLDDTSYGRSIDGLLGMSFLSRFEVQITSAYVQISPRGK